MTLRDALSILWRGGATFCRWLTQRAEPAGRSIFRIYSHRGRTVKRLTDPLLWLVICFLLLLAGLPHSRAV